MKRSDLRVVELFRHVRGAIDILERLALEAPVPSLPTDAPKATPELPKANSESEKIYNSKIAYSIKDVCQRVGISRSTIYHAIASKQLRAVMPYLPQDS
jgi:AraC-like DNA-binding protein